MKKRYIIGFVFSFCALVQADSPNSSDWLGTKPRPYSGPVIPRLAWGSIPEECTSIARFLQLKEAGITHHYQSYSNVEEAVKAMDAADKVGIKVIVSCPELYADPEKTVNRFKAHPALAAYFIKDEPRNEQAFIKSGICADKIRALDNEHWCYLNLLPGGKTNSVSGLPYATYLEWCARYFKPEVVSFDNYPISVDTTTGAIKIRRDWYDNLASIAEFSKQLGKPFWAFALTTHHKITAKTYAEPTLEQLRLQVFSDLAYGAQGIQYYTYWMEKNIYSGVYFYSAPIDAAGKKTKIYDYLKTVNEEINYLSLVFYGSTVKWVRHLGIESQRTVTALTDELHATPIKELKCQGGGILAALHQKTDIHYLIIVNYELKVNQLIMESQSAVQRILKSGAWVAAEKKIDLLPGDVAVYSWKK